MTNKIPLVWNEWRRHAEARPDAEAFVHLSAEKPAVRVTWQELITKSETYAAALVAQGVEVGDVCGLMVRHIPEFYALYLGICRAGGVPSVLAYPNARLHAEKFCAGLSGMARQSGLRWLLIERELEAKVAPLINGPESTIRGLIFPLEAPPTSERVAWPLLAPEAVMLLQHSSGTTGLQKGVALSHRAVLEHVRAYGRALGITPRDKVASWLPLYHDMGLIAAFHLPMATGIPVVMLDPFEWVMAPWLLLKAIADERATLTWLPNFALNLMADRIREEDVAGLDFSSLRLAINCSEPVRAESHARFLDRFAPHGLRREALATCYAMAETTFAVTQSRPGIAPSALPVDRELLTQGLVCSPQWGAETRVCLSSGQLLEGVEMKVVGEGGELCGDGRVGELVVRSPALFDGYHANPDATARVLIDGWFHTGDMGFCRDGDVFVVGRKKDLIIVAGKNIYPEDVEIALTDVEGVVPGRVVAFGVFDQALGTEQIWVAFEARPDADLASLPLAVKRAAMAIGITIAEVEIVPARWLVKSSSGKLSRSANRDRVLEQRMQGGKTWFLSA